MVLISSIRLQQSSLQRRYQFRQVKHHRNSLGSSSSKLVMPRAPAMNCLVDHPVENPNEEEPKEGFADSADKTFGNEGDDSVQGGLSGEGTHGTGSSRKRKSSGPEFNIFLDSVLSKFRDSSKEDLMDRGWNLAAETPGLMFGETLNGPCLRMLQMPMLLRQFIHLKTPEERVRMVQLYDEGFYTR